MACFLDVTKVVIKFEKQEINRRKEIKLKSLKTFSICLVVGKA